MAYIDVAKLSIEDSDLRWRLMVAISTAAIAVLREPVNTPNHVNRLKWSVKALNDISSMANMMIWGVASDPNVSKDVPDNTLQTLVNGLIDTYANAV